MLCICIYHKIIFQDGWTFVLPNHHLSGHQSDLHGQSIVMHLLILIKLTLVYSHAS